ncbi:MAG: hypothetical protein CMB17_06360 [Euryarchaeota archaeon]|nr:hypothetical protein [Euryarchaeota archaeon]|tara:strand:+ start:2475 stop:3413 length:939 start_codon:yes stop_codon:yes gene_type:complete
MALPPASGPALHVWEMGDEILLRLMDGRIQRTADTMSYWRDPEQPYPIPIQQAIKCEDIAIITWMDPEIRVSIMGGMNFLENNWKSNYSNRTELQNSNGIIGHESQLWLHSLDAEVLAMTSYLNKFAFVSMNRGVYFLESNESGPKEIWRTEIPDWPKPWANATWRTNENTNGNLDTHAQSIHLDEENLILFDERGSWVMFSLDEGKEINSGRLPFKGKNTGTWRGENSWAILEDNRKLHLLTSNFELTSTHKTPGPVNFARDSINGWIWTGWRHDGTERSIIPRSEIGLWIDENENPRVISNDGKWHDFSL